MILPVIPLPFPVSEAIPVLLHPIVVHFAVVLPLVILILEFINMITKRKALTITIYILFVMLVGVFVGALYSGVIDGKNGGLFLSDEGLAHLKDHKLIGIYLLYFSIIPITLKLLTLAVKKPWAKIIYILSFVGLIALTTYQAKEGGELVYEYGLNVEAKMALEDAVEELQDELDELESDYEEDIALLKEQLKIERSRDCNVTVIESKAEKADIIVESSDSNVTKVDVNVSQEVNSTK